MCYVLLCQCHILLLDTALHTAVGNGQAHSQPAPSACHDLQAKQQAQQLSQLQLPPDRSDSLSSDELAAAAAAVDQQLGEPPSAPAGSSPKRKVDIPRDGSIASHQTGPRLSNGVVAGGAALAGAAAVGAIAAAAGGPATAANVPSPGGLSAAGSQGSFRIRRAGTRLSRAPLLPAQHQNVCSKALPCCHPFRCDCPADLAAGSSTDVDGSIRADSTPGGPPPDTASFSTPPSVQHAHVRSASISSVGSGVQGDASGGKIAEYAQLTQVCNCRQMPGFGTATLYAHCDEAPAVARRNHLPVAKAASPGL